MRAPFWPALLLLAAGSCGGPEANPRSQDPYERFLGARELVGQTDAETMRTLVTLLDDPHYLVVTGAIDVLAGYGRPEFLQHFVPKLKHKHPLVRQEACAAIATIRNEEGLPSLIETLKDPEPAVRRSALKALAAFDKNASVRRAMVDAVADKDISVSYMAHRLLSDLTGRSDVPRTKDDWARAVP
jgi:HEAT repeat protein